MSLMEAVAALCMRMFLMPLAASWQAIVSAISAVLPYMDP